MSENIIIPELPNKCFISHSYEDSNALESLISLLPRNVKPVIFPPIVLAPDKMTSEELIQAILACEGVIYLHGGASSRSFWVTFERDYALRSGKKVFSFDPKSLIITQDTSLPLTLKIHPYYDGNADCLPDDPDATISDRILNYMNKERFFDVLFPMISLPLEGTDYFLLPLPPGAELPKLKDMLEFIRTGWDILIIWSSVMTYSDDFKRTTQEELENALKADPELVKAHVLIALADSTPLPSSFKNLQQVQLYGDLERTETQRIDDLIVRLYWLIYQHTNNHSEYDLAK